MRTKTKQLERLRFKGILTKLKPLSSLLSRCIAKGPIVEIT
jgi:hypothetical protein